VATEPVIRAEGLTKYYGSQCGIEDITLEIEHGEVFGFLGPNGAGKTTFIRTLLDLIHPTRGRATVLGLDTRRDSVAVRARTGYVPGELALYTRMSGEEHVGYFAALRNGAGRVRAGELAERLDLDLTRRAAELSKGNKQKLGIVLAFMHEPELLLLDEPTSGLDPLLQQEFRALLSEAATRGATVLLSSHVLTEVEHTADRVAIVRAGHVVAVAGMDEIKQQALRRLEVRFVSAADVEALRRVPGVREVREHGNTVVLVTEGSMDALVKALASYEVASLASHELDLEDVFMRYYRGTDG